MMASFKPLINGVFLSLRQDVVGLARLPLTAAMETPSVTQAGLVIEEVNG